MPIYLHFNIYVCIILEFKRPNTWLLFDERQEIDVLETDNLDFNLFVFGNVTGFSSKTG